MLRKNGFKRPFHKLQIVSWVYTLALFGIFCFMALPLLNSHPKLIVTILYSLSLLTVLISGFLCTAADPADPAIKETLQAKILSNPTNHRKYPKICKICKYHVNSDTKHCRECNKCILHFDHHCKWLNNCIGKKNYKYFCVLIGSFELHSLVITISGGLVINGLVKKTEVYDNLTGMISQTAGGYEFFLALLILMEVMSIIAGISTGQLIVFHIYLGAKHYTTYDYIISKRKNIEKYKVSSVNIDGKEPVDDIQLEDVYEPYIQNPQFRSEVESNCLHPGSQKIIPSFLSLSRSSQKDESSFDNINETIKNI